MIRSHINRAALRIAAPLVLLAALLCAPAAQAASSAPAWSITAVSAPTNFAPSSYSEYYVVATNGGGAPTSGPITISETLPTGFTPAEAEGLNIEIEEFPCEITGQKVTCTTEEAVRPGEYLRLAVRGRVQAEPATLEDEASVSGGGAAEASTKTETTVSSENASFGFLPGSTGFASTAVQADGSPARLAGSHPYAINVGAQFPSAKKGVLLNADDHLRDIHVELPRGVVANPQATPVRCTEAELESDLEEEAGGGCPPASQVGVIYLTAVVANPTTQADPLYNMVPPAGKPAEFGFDAAGYGIYVHLVGGLKTGSYQLSASSNDILAKLTILGVQATLWGNPSDPSHDYQRGFCASNPERSNCPTTVAPTTTPFLTMPTSCEGPLTTTASVDSWEHAGEFKTESTPLAGLDGRAIGLEGCSSLDFTPSISVKPDTTVADSPSGLEVDLKVPQSGGVNTRATANLKEAVVELPAGMSVSPSAANGLEACSLEQIALESSAPATCPNGSKVGSVEVTTPLLPSKLEGGIYLAQQGNLPGHGTNPFGTLLAIYVDAEAEGAVVKLAGKVEANPSTGQLTTTFADNPQLPFSDFKLDFYGGPRAALDTPEACGAYAPLSSLSPWSGTAPVSLSEPFDITSGCVSGFSPSFSSGVENPQAGAESPFTLSFSRSDSEQQLSGLTATLPPGLIAKLAGVPLCTDAQLAAAATESASAEQAASSCTAGSQVGTVQAASGPGQDPFHASGRAYLTGPYKGAPYGLAEVIPVLAGPFDLGTVVVRQKLEIDEHDAHVTAVSDPLPSIIEGIPLRLRSVSVDLSRPGFMVNPTSCEPMAVAGTLTSTGGASKSVSSRFQMGGCGALPFTPTFAVAIGGHHTRKDGESMHVTVESGAGQANVAKVDVELPKALAVRDSTLNQACTEQQFASNPAGCPEGSIVGNAVVSTPILAKPLEGPAMFVSHGGKEFPDLDIVLQGEGITIELTGNTYVTENGYTFSRFESVPDAPISRFDLYLPTGPHSALGGNGNLCFRKVTHTTHKKVRRHGRTHRKAIRITKRVRRSLIMPTTITGQNGAVVEQGTQMSVEGCPTKAKRVRRHVVRRVRHHGRRR